ncbi:MAG: hypothetical protein ACYTBP_17075 [Planctomycetota bacterium]|jgi:uncharacterized protein YjbI with pentapeptide repeats
MYKELKIPDEWSDAEQWAWGEIRAGRIADFQKRYNKKLDPKKPDGWDDEQKDRLLSNAFLVTILTEESFRSVTPFKGVRINQARFKESIDLQHARLERQLWLENCRLHGTLSLMNLNINGWLSLEESWFGGAIDLNGSVFDSHVSLKQVKIEGEVDLTGAKIGGQLDMSGSIFDDRIIMNGTEVGQDLFMRDKATFKEVELRAAKIGGQIDMSGSIFKGKLNMNGTEVGQHLFMRDKATFKDVDLGSAKIGGQLTMVGSIFDDKLNMNAVEVGQDLFMRDKATFEEVQLGSAKIEGQLDMSGSIFKGKLNMNGVEVGQSLFMRDKATFKEVVLGSAKIGGQISIRGGIFDDKLDMNAVEVGQSLFMRSSKFPEDQEVILHFARIGSNLDLSGATIGAIDLTSTTITSEIRLGSAMGHEPTNWVGDSRMILRNTTVGAIQDSDVTEESWPKNLELEGFEFSRLGGYGAEGSADILNRNSKWFIDWLGRDKTFSPQPYELLAKVLHESGYPSKANAIRYAARKRSRYEAWNRREGKPREKLRWLGLTLLQLTIGYGLGARYFRVLWWFGGFTLIGFLVLLASIDKPNVDLFKMAWASFDQVLPIVTLNEAHEDLILGNCTGWAIKYFYVQKLVGYVLGGFLGAGLAGLTQKS